MSEIYHQLELELDRVTVTPDGGTLFGFENRNATIPMVILNFQYGPKGNPRLVEVSIYLRLGISYYRCIKRCCNLLNVL